MSKKPIRRRPRPTPLPGMETVAIKSLENAAFDLADIREQIVDLRNQIAAAKHRIVKALHAANKTTYRRNGVAVELVAGSEDVKVRIVKSRPDADAPTADASEFADARRAAVAEE